MKKKSCLGQEVEKMSDKEKILDPVHKEHIKELLFQLADDDFLFSYRGSEWLGLAPHIEEDIAFSSISQDTMGHAAMYYELIANLESRTADELAHLRPSHERRNCILVERVNGEGFYKDTPKYDWAYAVVRNYFYTLAKNIKIDSLTQSSYEPLVDISRKVKMELYYHLLHWRTWFVQLLSATDEAKQRLKEAISKVEKDLGDLFSCGEKAEKIYELKLIEDEETLKERWMQEMEKVCRSLQIPLPNIPNKYSLNGRNGEHTEEIESALATLSEVYRLDTNTAW
jgi:ring-1,2-phenylacetyl-CoA epoxidase subunit PaaC